MSHFDIDLLYSTFVTKQAALVRRSTVLDLPVQLVFPAECVYSLIGHYHEIKVDSYIAHKGNLGMGVWFSCA